MFSIQGEHCTMDVNECTHNPCQNGGTCVNALGSFECLCTSNTTGHLCRELVTTPNIMSDSSNIYFDEKIGLVLSVLVVVLIAIILIILIKRLRNKRRARRNNEGVEMTSNEIIKNKTNENSNRISKMSNLEASYPGMIIFPFSWHFRYFFSFLACFFLVHFAIYLLRYCV